MSGAELRRSREDVSFVVGVFATLFAGLTWGAQLLGWGLSPLSILNPGGEVEPASWPPSRICAVFLMFHSIRLWLGITFLDFDESFVAAVEEEEKKYPDKMKPVLRTHLVTLYLVYGSVVLGPAITAVLPYSMPQTIVVTWMPFLGFCILSIALTCQSIGLVILDINWWSILISSKSGDKERSANKFFIIGDFVIVLFTGVLITCAVFIAAGGPSNSHITSALFLWLLGALLAIFAGECWSQYWGALLLRWANASAKRAEAQDSAA